MLENPISEREARGNQHLADKAAEAEAVRKEKTPVVKAFRKATGFNYKPPTTLRSGFKKAHKA